MKRSHLYSILITAFFFTALANNAIADISKPTCAEIYDYVKDVPTTRNPSPNARQLAGKIVTELRSEEKLTSLFGTPPSSWSHEDDLKVRALVFRECATTDIILESKLRQVFGSTKKLH